MTHGLSRHRATCKSSGLEARSAARKIERMGMYASLFLFRDDHLRRMIAEPALFDLELFKDDPQVPLPKQPWWSRWFGKGPTLPRPLELGEHEGEAGDVDKAWHGLHFLLTGTAEGGEPPLNLLVATDHGVALAGSQAVDYGEPRAFFSDYTRRAHEALAALSDDELMSRYDPAAMMELQIYPSVWDRPDEGPEYLLEYLEKLRELLEKAAKYQLGVVVLIH